MRKEGGIYKKSFYCCDLPGCTDGGEIFDLFLLSKLDYCSNDRAVKWFNAILSDCSGRVRAKIWSDKMQMEYEGYEGQIVLVRGRINYYAGHPEISVEKMKLMEEGTYCLQEVCRTLNPKRQEGYVKKILELTEKISNSKLKDLVKSILDKKALEQMGQLPVQLKGHHDYRGAFLEHTCETAFSAYCLGCSAASVHNIKVNMDLIIAGALLHDLAAFYQYKAEGYGFEEENMGRLIGREGIIHTVLNEKKDIINSKESFYGMLVHIILSAHEDGIAPMTMEAMIVRSANRLSAELERYESTQFSNHTAYGQKEGFVWSKALKRVIYMREDRNDREESVSKRD